MHRHVLSTGMLLCAWMCSAEGPGRRLWAQDIQPLSIWKAGGLVVEVAFSPDGKTLAAGIRRLDRSREIGRAALGGSISYMPAEIRFWEVATGKHLRSITEDPPCSDLRFSPDGKTFVTCGSVPRTGGEEFLRGVVKIWDSRTAQERLQLAQDRIVTSTAFTPDGKTLATGSFDGTVRLWELPAGKPRAVFRGHRSIVHCVAFDSKGTTLASGGYDEIACLWDLASGKKRASLEAEDPIGPGQGVFSLAFSPDDALLACGVDDGVKVWNVAARKLAHVRLPKERCSSLAFSPDGKLLAWQASDRIVRIWNLESGKEMRLVGHTDSIHAIAFGGKGRLLATGSSDQTIRLWDVAGMTSKQP